MAIHGQLDANEVDDATPENLLLSRDDRHFGREVPKVIAKDAKMFEVARDHVDMAQRTVLNEDQFFDWINDLAEFSVDKMSGGKGDSDDGGKELVPRRFYFRGEPSSAYRLLPSLLRSGVYDSLRAQHGATNPIHLQRKLLDRYKRYTQHLIHADGDFKSTVYQDFDTLCLAQHHGLPTLLMDWTLNPYVAAYFALSGITPTMLTEKLRLTNGEMNTYYARVWVMRLRSSRERQDATVHLEDRGREWDPMLGKSGETPNYPRIVVPLVFTRRIASQVGRFVYCGFMKPRSVEDPNKHSKKPAATGREHAETSSEYASLVEYSWDVTRGKKIDHMAGDVMPWDQLYSLDIAFDISDKSLNKASPGKPRTGKTRRHTPRSSEATESLIEEKRKRFQQAISKTMKRLEFMGFHAGRLFPDLEGWAQYLREGNL